MFQAKIFQPKDVHLQSKEHHHRGLPYFYPYFHNFERIQVDCRVKVGILYYHYVLSVNPLMEQWLLHPQRLLMVIFLMVVTLVMEFLILVVRAKINYFVLVNHLFYRLFYQIPVYLSYLRPVSGYELLKVKRNTTDSLTIDFFRNIYD